MNSNDTSYSYHSYEVAPKRKKQLNLVQLYEKAGTQYKEGIPVLIWNNVDFGKDSARACKKGL